MFDAINAEMDAAVLSGQANALAELARLCAIPSVSAKGEHLPECAELVADLMRAHGLDAQIMPVENGPPIAFGTAHGNRADAPTVLFYNHYDVQPAEPLDLWDSPPFELTLRDGKAIARGVGDDKGHIVSRLLALDAVRQAHGGALPFHVKFVAEGEEEVGSPHIGAWIQANLDLLSADACIWEEGGEDENGTPALYCGMRGIAYFELHVKTIAYDAHSGNGGSLLPNAAWRLVWALSTLKDSNERILLPGHYDKARLPTLRDLQLLDALPPNESTLREQFGLTEHTILGGAQTTGLEFKRRAVFEPTLTLCGLDSGWQGMGAKTVLPSEARAKMDFRLVPDQDPEDVHRAAIWTRADLPTLRFAISAVSARPAWTRIICWCACRRKPRGRCTASPLPSRPCLAVRGRCGLRVFSACPLPVPASNTPDCAPTPPTRTFDWTTYAGNAPSLPACWRLLARIHDEAV